jgi:hypothetical protein
MSQSISQRQRTSSNCKKILKNGVVFCFGDLVELLKEQREYERVKGLAKSFKGGGEVVVSMCLQKLQKVFHLYHVRELRWIIFMLCLM